MKNKLRTTEGEWKKVIKDRGGSRQPTIQVVLPNGLSLYLGTIHEDNCTVETCCHVEEHSNARLIEDAGNTANKCGKLPSELLKERDDLIKIAKTCWKYLPVDLRVDLNKLIK